MRTDNELIRIGMEESHDMCGDCGDAVATTQRGWGMGRMAVCSDCNDERGC